MQEGIGFIAENSKTNLPNFSRERLVVGLFGKFVRKAG
jgi:hypothetical protein